MAWDDAGSDGTGDTEREIERLSGDLLDGRVPSADAPPPPAQPSPPIPPAAGVGSDPTARAIFVLRTLDDVAAPVPIGFDPAPQAAGPAAMASDASGQHVLDAVVAGTTRTDDGPASSGSTGAASGDDLRTVAAMTTHAPASLAEPLDGGATFGARHARNLAVAGVAVVALAAFIGALLALQGAGATPGSPVDQAAAAPASVASPVEPSPVEPSLVEASPVEPSDGPTPEPTATPAPTATPSPEPGAVTIRGPIDASSLSSAGMRVGAHEARLAFDPEGGPVTGTFTIEIKEFPIGALLTRTFEGEDDPDFATFKTCTVTLALVGKVNGNYDAGAGRLSGKAAFRAATDDVDDCLKTRPSNLTIDPDKVAKPTTVKWRARFNGTRATGSLDLEPALDFSATTED